MVRRIAKIRYKPTPTGARILPVGANLLCADNSGARFVQLISVDGYKSRKKRLMVAGVGDMVSCRVTKGKPELRHQVHKGIVIRVKKEYRRYTGERIKFEDNALVLVTKDGKLKGTEIKGVVAKEAAERWPHIASATTLVI
jgi:large subunit ribosomal protein L14